MILDNSLLAHIKVIELARILAGPWAGQVLADLGADVLKVESPQGDETRRWGPPFVPNADGTRDAAYFHATNRGKRSMIADFARAEDIAKLHALATKADVVIENFKVGSLAKFGLDYRTLAAINPRLIYCSITGFGLDGPYAHRSGYDFIVQAMSGIMDLTGETHRPAQKMGVALVDVMTGLYAVIGIQAALAERARSGLGQQVDLSLLDVMVGTLANQGLNYLVTRESPVRLGNAHPNLAPYESFECRDGWLIIAVGSDAQFARLATLLDLAGDTRFSTNADRVVHRVYLSRTINAATQTWQRDSLLTALHRIAVPASPINSVAQAFEDPQVVYRQMALLIQRRDGTSVPGIRTPLRFSRSELNPPRASPRLGDAKNADEWPSA